MKPRTARAMARRSPTVGAAAVAGSRAANGRKGESRESRGRGSQRGKYGRSSKRPELLVLSLLRLPSLPPPRLARKRGEVIRGRIKAATHAEVRKSRRRGTLSYHATPLVWPTALVCQGRSKTGRGKRRPIRGSKRYGMWCAAWAGFVGVSVEEDSALAVMWYLARLRMSRSPPKGQH